MHAATVLLSGGLDSTVLLHYVVKHLQRQRVHALSFNYAQRHVREIEMAAWQARQLDAVEAHHIIDLSVLDDVVAGASALVRGGGDVPEMSSISAAAADQPPTYVPNRNMILLSLAAAYAESHACNEVYYGAQSQDEYGYWDCTPAFVQRVNGVLSLNRRQAVKILAPFVNKSKAEEIQLGNKLGVDFAHTWSCYRGGEEPCGNCPTCVERRNAFREAGLADPLGG